MSLWETEGEVSMWETEYEVRLSQAIMAARQVTLSLERNSHIHAKHVTAEHLYEMAARVGVEVCEDSECGGQVPIWFFRTWRLGQAADWTPEEVAEEGRSLLTGVPSPKLAALLASVLLLGSADIEQQGAG